MVLRDCGCVVGLISVVGFPCHWNTYRVVGPVQSLNFWFYFLAVIGGVDPFLPLITSLGVTYEGA